MPYAHIILSLSSIFLKIKRVWFQHGPVAGFLDQIAILTPVNTIYFNSTYLEKIHLEMPFAKTKKLKNHIVNLGIAAHRTNESELKSLREKYLSSNEQIIISNVGRICKGKGQKNIIESINKLKIEAPNQFKKIKLLIIGDVGRKEDNDYKLSIISLVKKYQLEEHIIFIGQTNEVEKYYQASDIYISSSLTPEPFGLTIIEAMINKSLVITDNKGGLSNYLINQETCVTYNSAEDVAKDKLYNVLNETIQQFTDHPENIKLIKNNAFEMAHTNFSIESMTKNIEDSYLNLWKN
jgi:glycosyltransferase involved in cell wall biosynthesis